MQLTRLQSLVISIEQNDNRKQTTYFINSLKLDTLKKLKVRFIATLTILIVICGCAKEKSIQTINEDKSTTTIAGTWKVVSYDDLANNTQITKYNNNTWTNFNNGDVIITFQDTLDTGLIHGVTVINGVSGNYILSNQRKIRVENFMGTEINQPVWANLFWENLPKSEEYSVNNTQLRLFYNSKKNSITFEKK